MPYEVQTYTLCDGWVNTWLYEDDSGKMVPETFPTAEAAQAAIDEHLEDLDEEVTAGNIASYDRREFRIAKTGGAA